jgi:ATP adenylyltransferase
MERLYTPWRWDYMVNPKPNNCPFCDYLAQDASHDPENFILLRAPKAFIVLNRYPYSNGHLMALPNEHVSTLAVLDDETQFELMKLTTYCTQILQEAYHPHGFNVGINIGKAAGAGMEAHLHVHIVPRWQGDTNFMPVIGKTKVMPETLESVYARLKRMMEKIPPPLFRI